MACHSRSKLSPSEFSTRRFSAGWDGDSFTAAVNAPEILTSLPEGRAHLVRAEPTRARHVRGRPVVRTGASSPSPRRSPAHRLRVAQAARCTRFAPFPSLRKPANGGFDSCSTSAPAASRCCSRPGLPPPLTGDLRRSGRSLGLTWLAWPAYSLRLQEGKYEFLSTIYRNSTRKRSS